MNSLWFINFFRKASNWLFIYFCKYWPKFNFSSFFDRRVNELLVTNPILLHIIDLFDKNRPEAIQKLDITTYRSKTTAILVPCHFGTMACLVQKNPENPIFRLQKNIQIKNFHNRSYLEMRNKITDYRFLKDHSDNQKLAKSLKTIWNPSSYMNRASTSVYK